MSRFSVDIEVANYRDLTAVELGVLAPEKVRRKTISGVVDCGASSLVLPKGVADDLGFPSAGNVRVIYADKSEAIRPRVRDVHVKLLGRDGTFSAGVEPKREDALIGAIVLEELDFVVDCKGECLLPRDPKQVTAIIE